MKTFNEIREDAKNVFFDNHNFLYAKDFLYDFIDNKLIPCDVQIISNGSFISFIEYSYAFDTDDIFGLIEENYDDKMESIPKLSKIFDDWFEKFYYNITNTLTDYPKTIYGDYIHAQFEFACC